MNFSTIVTGTQVSLVFMQLSVMSGISAMMTVTAYIVHSSNHTV